MFEWADAVLCTDFLLRSLVGLSLAPEHGRGHGALYDGTNQGRADIACLRDLVAAVNRQLPHNGCQEQPRSHRAGGGRVAMAAPDANTAGERSFCHTYGRGKVQPLMVPGWPYSVVVALETGRTSWTALEVKNQRAAETAGTPPAQWMVSGVGGSLRAWAAGGPRLTSGTPG